VVELLNQVINKFDEVALKYKISIKQDFQVEKSMLLIDHEKLTIALSNIISNALRFSFENTTIIISVGESKDNVEIEIADEGIGVGTDDLTSVFKEYYVISTYSVDKEKCVGLGLTIAEKIIQKHKGFISFESVLGKGSSVKIVFPKEDLDFIS
jgi:signal transduction histidine kinase